MSTAAQIAASSPDHLEFYRFRDELAETYNPANAVERMLITQIAQAWFRLQLARATEQKYFEGRDMVEVITTKLKEFQAVTRFTTDCDRSFRHAVATLQRVQRRRKSQDLSSPNARRSPNPPRTYALAVGTASVNPCVVTTDAKRPPG